MPLGKRNVSIKITMTSKRKEIYSWALYDWACSAYSTTIMAGFFPLFFKGYWSAGADTVATTARLGDLTSSASLVVALITPFLGALADRRGSKKLFLFLFTLLSVIGCGALGFLGEGAWLLASAWYALATISFNAGATFYDALLPSVARPHETDHVSSLGYALGYLGGGVLFLINVLMYLFPSHFGLAHEAAAVKASFASVGFWWLAFSVPLFLNVREPNHAPPGLPLLKAFRQSLFSLGTTARDIARDRNLLFFLLAFWLYIDGVYTVMTMAVDFGLAIGLAAKDLIAALLLVQFVGFPSALGFGYLSGRWGSKGMIAICVVSYAITTVLAAKMSEAWHFYLLALIIGLVQGGVQALSRSLFSRLIPENRSGELFGFMNLIGRFAAIFGPFLVARATQWTGDHRSGLQSLLVLFALGLFFLSRVKENPQTA